jgi:hypothetical protein
MDSVLCTGRIGDNYGVYFSTDYGTSWQWNNVDNSYIYSLATDQENLFAGGDENMNGFFFSADKGLTWIKNNDGFPFSPEIRCFTIKNSTLYVGTNGLSVWKQSIGSIVGISEALIEPKSKIFPNPSSGNFTLSLKGNIQRRATLTITNSIGEIILQESFIPEKNISIDLTHQPKGIYFATIFDGEKFSNEKLVVQ